MFTKQWMDGRLDLDDSRCVLFERNPLGSFWFKSPVSTTNYLHNVVWGPSLTIFRYRSSDKLCFQFEFLFFHLYFLKSNYPTYHDALGFIPFCGWFCNILMPEGRCSSKKENWKKGNILMLCLGGRFVFCQYMLCHAKAKWRIDFLCGGKNKWLFKVL